MIFLAPPARRSLSSTTITSPHNIGLMLEDCCVADSNGSGVLITGEVQEFPFLQVAFAPYAVHYLQIFRITRQRTQKPVAPLQASDS